MNPVWHYLFEIVSIVFAAVIFAGVVGRVAIQTYCDLRDYWRKRKGRLGPESE